MKNVRYSVSTEADAPRLEPGIHRVMFEIPTQAQAGDEIVLLRLNKHQHAIWGEIRTEVLPTHTISAELVVLDGPHPEPPPSP